MPGRFKRLPALQASPAIQEWRLVQAGMPVRGQPGARVLDCQSVWRHAAALAHSLCTMA